MQQEKQKKSTEAKLYCKINLKIDIAVRAFSNLPLPPLVLQLTTYFNSTNRHPKSKVVLIPFYILL